MPAESNPQLNPGPLLCLSIFSLIAVRSEALFFFHVCFRTKFCVHLSSLPIMLRTQCLRPSQRQSYLYFLFPSWRWKQSVFSKRGHVPTKLRRGTRTQQNRTHVIDVLRSSNHKRICVSTLTESATLITWLPRSSNVQRRVLRVRQVPRSNLLPDTPKCWGCTTNRPDRFLLHSIQSGGYLCVPNSQSLQSVGAVKHRKPNNQWHKIISLH